MPSPKPDTRSRIRPVYEESARFLHRWAPEGPWVLTAIDPDKRGIDTRTFRPETEDKMMAWLQRQGSDRNIYFTVNPVIRALDNKPSREHIRELAWLHVDLDPRAGKDLDNERMRIENLLGKPSGGIPKPTCVIFSGGGYQGFWKLKEPLQLDGSVEECEEAKRYNKQIEIQLGGDNCHNVDRIMRLPGTVNRPDRRKRAKGRTEALANLEWWDDFEYDLDSFTKAPEVAARGSAQGQLSGAQAAVEVSGSIQRFSSVDDIKELRDRPQARVVIVQGKDPDDPHRHPSRSEWLYYACCEMVRAGCDDDTIYSVITDPDFRISDSVLKQGASAEEYALRQIERARGAEECARHEFQADKDGRPYRNLHNARVALIKLGVSVCYDEFAERPLIHGLSGFGPHLEDAAVTRLRLEADERFGIIFAKEWFTDFLMDQARRSIQHPVREYLGALTWDGVGRIDDWLTTYLGAVSSRYSRAVGALFLIAAVRRVRSPGCKFDEMLVLEGPQGGAKSTALAALAGQPEWFTDDLPLNAKAQQFIEQTVGKWIVEAGELKGMRKGDVESLKATLSRSVDRSRMAYGRLPLERARQFVIFGTTNSKQYLRDGTGNRRFWPIEVGAVDLAALRRDRDMLWAEAAERELSGASIRLDPSLYAAAGSEQDARRVEDPFVETLGEALEGLEGKLRAEDAWTLLGLEPGRRVQEHNARLGDAMRELGWERTKLRFGGASVWCYAKGGPQARRRRLSVHLDVATGRMTVNEEIDSVFGGEGERQPCSGDR